MKRFTLIILLITICTPLYMHAQFGYAIPLDDADDLYYTYIETPVKDERVIKKELFTIDKNEQNHVFKITLPDDNFLLIDFYRMSYWPTPSDLQNITDIGANTAEKVSGKFTNPYTSKKINIHVPIKDRPVTVRLTDNDDGTDMLVMDEGKPTPIKVGMDTIRILKTYKTEKDEDPSRIQYTFILKDLSYMATLANNKTLMADIAHTIDSVVAYKRSKWKKEDVWYHRIGIFYKPLETDQNEKLSVKNIGSPGIFKGLDVDYYIGATIFRNTVTPAFEMGASYKFPDTKNIFTYIRTSLVAMPQFEKVTQARFDFYNTNFANVEIGTIINKKNTRVPIYTTSVGFGYMFSNHPSLEPHNGYRMFFHYGVSPAIRITGNLYLLDIKGQDNQVWSGLTVSVRLF